MSALPLPHDPPPHPAVPRLWVVRPLPRYEPDEGPTLPAPPALRLVPPPVAAPAGPAPARPRVPGGRTDPATRHAATRLLQTVLEVLDRRRPAAHLATVASPALARRVTASLLAPPRAGRPPARLRTVHAQRTGSSAEVCARLERGGRSHAVAARIELVGDRWVATALRVG